MPVTLVEKFTIYSSGVSDKNGPSTVTVASFMDCLVSGEPVAPPPEGNYTPNMDFSFTTGGYTPNMDFSF